MAPASFDEALERLRKGFDAEAASGLRAAYAFELSGPGGGVLGVRIDAGRLELLRSAPPEPVATLRLSTADFLAVLGGRENADLLFMAGRLEVQGDLGLALRLRRIFGAPA